METEIKMLYIIEALIIYDIMKFLITVLISLCLPTPTVNFKDGQIMSLKEFEKEIKKSNKEDKDE
tara:strand:+ start:671 stop:865 length:195 start_codon:yes stop_codon:yes gene_type:complete